MRSLDHWQQFNPICTRNWIWVIRLWSCKNWKTVTHIWGTCEIRATILYPFGFKRSEDKASRWAVKSKIGWALSSPLLAKQTATLATTTTSIPDGKLANQLSKWWDIESYSSNCDGTGHSKEGHRAIKTLEPTTHFNGERYEVGLLWLEDEVKLPNNFYSAMVQLKSLEQRLQKNKTLKRRHQENVDADVKAGDLRKVEQTDLKKPNPN